MIVAAVDATAAIPRRPASTSLAFGARRGSARKTHMSATTLERLVGAPVQQADDTVRSNTNSVMIQTSVGMGDVQLLETLVGCENVIGIVTASHARDVDIFRCYQLRMLEAASMDEERERRIIEAQDLELRRSLTLLSSAFLQKLRAMRTYGGHRESRSPRFIAVGLDRSGLGSPTFDSQLPSPSSVTSPTALDNDEVERLRERLLLLEERVRSTAKARQPHNIASAARQTIATRRGSASLGGKQDAAIEAFLLGQETLQRRHLADHELDARKLLAAALSHAALERSLRDATRVMVHAPFTSYRPKIPIQHSLAGEEYLRRWILVETLQHYEDCVTLLQQHENDKRNAIEDEYNASADKIFAMVFLPHYVVRSIELDTALQQEKERAAAQQRQSDALYATMKLRVIVSEEAALREVLKASCIEMLNTLRLVVVELADLRGVHAKAKRLEGELSRQARRRQEEVGYLVSQLPRQGVIHPNSAMLAELNSRSTASGSPDGHRVASHSPTITSTSMRLNSAVSYRVAPSPGTASGGSNHNDMYPLGMKVQSILIKHGSSGAGHTSANSSSSAYARPSTPTSHSKFSTSSSPDADDDIKAVASVYFAGF